MLQCCSVTVYASAPSAELHYDPSQLQYVTVLQCYSVCFCFQCIVTLSSITTTVCYSVAVLQCMLLIPVQSYTMIHHNYSMLQCYSVCFCFQCIVTLSSITTTVCYSVAVLQCMLLIPVQSYTIIHHNYSMLQCCSVTVYASAPSAELNYHPSQLTVGNEALIGSDFPK